MLRRELPKAWSISQVQDACMASKGLIKIGLKVRGLLLARHRRDPNVQMIYKALEVEKWIRLYGQRVKRMSPN